MSVIRKSAKRVLLYIRTATVFLAFRLVVLEQVLEKENPEGGDSLRRIMLRTHSNILNCRETCMKENKANIYYLPKEKLFP